MKHRCPDLPGLERILHLDPEDPRRQGLARCARCHATALSYLEFLQDETLPWPARPEDAARQLRRGFEAELARRPGPERARGARFSGWRPRAAGPIWALGASVAIVLAVVGSWQMFREAATVDHLREAPAEHLPEAGLALLPVETTPDGSVVLRWRSVPDATSYSVRLLNADLAELSRLGPVTDTLMVLPPGSFPERTRPALLGWQVLALRESREPASSTIGALSLP